MTDETANTETTDNVETTENVESTEVDYSFLNQKYLDGGRTNDEAVLEQAKGYSELLNHHNEKLKGFTGAPEEYELSFSEELTKLAEEKGLDLLDAEHPRVQELFEKGKELGMNQEAINGLIELDAMHKVAEHEAYEEFKAEQIAALGTDGQQRIEAIDKWGQANMGDSYEALIGMATDAEQFQVLEKLINMTKNAPVVEPTSAPAPGITMEDINREQFKEDKYGQRLMAVDPQHRAKVKQMYEQLNAQ